MRDKPGNNCSISFSDIPTLLGIGLSVAITTVAGAETQWGLSGDAFFKSNDLLVAVTGDGSASAQAPRNSNGAYFSVRGVGIGVGATHNGNLVVGAFDMSNPFADLQTLGLIKIGVSGHGSMTINPNPG